MTARRASWIAAGALVVTSIGADAQQGRGGGAAPAAGPNAPPPIVWASPPLPAGPIAIESAVPQHRSLRVVIVARGIPHPWAMAFLPDGGILVTERGGRLRIVRNGVLDPAPVAGVPAVRAQRLSGLMDIALHPRFAENRFIYFAYHKPVGETGRVTALGRGTWNGTALTDVREMFATDVPGTTEASRIVFGRDGMLYLSLGNATEGENAPAQNPNHYGGKLLRLRDDGAVPPDNPFVGKPGYKPEIYSLGHRNQLGMAVNPETGEIWAGEQGPNGGDEINIIAAGRNYGWPMISYGRSYMGGRVTERPFREGMEQPIVSWIPSIALSGLTFYTGDKFPGWKRNVFVGGLREGETPRTGQIQRIEFNERWEEIRREPMLRELKQRVRDVREGPDGYLYVLTEEDDGALLRIEPAGDASPATK